MIIDNHTHIWPHHGEEIEWDYASVDEHMKYLQRQFFTFGPAAAAAGMFRRVKDDSPAGDSWKILWDTEAGPSWEARCDVNFRYEKGKFLWEKDGEVYYRPAAPPMPAELLVFLMDSVGVDKAVLQHTFNCRKLNRYNARAVQKYPDRLIGLTYLDTTEAYTRQQEVIEELDTAIRVLGLKGLMWASDGPHDWDGYDNFHTSKYDPFWGKVSSLGIPVYAVFDMFNYPIPQIIEWVEKFPDIPRVLVHGLPLGVYQKKESIRLPGNVIDLVKENNIYLEILPGMDPGIDPKTEEEIVRYLYETFGASKLLWGWEGAGGGIARSVSAYGKIVNYFEEKCGYMSGEDLKLLMGENLQKLFEI